MTITLTGHGFGLQGAASGAINMTGSSVIIACQSKYMPFGSGTTSDSLGNTYTNLTFWNDGSLTAEQMSYCLSPTVSSSMTLTASSSGSDIYAAGYTGISGFGNEGGLSNPTAGGTINFGSFTTDGSLYLIVMGICAGGATSLSSDASFTFTDFNLFVGGVSWCGAQNYFVDTTITSLNFEFTSGGNAFPNATMALAVFTAGSPPQNITMNTGIITLAGFALGVDAKQQITMTQATMTFAGKVLGVNGKQMLTAATAVLTFVGNALAVTNQASISISTAVLTFVGQALTVAVRQNIAMVAGVLKLVGQALAVNGKAMLTMATGVLKFVGQALHVTNIAPGTAKLIWNKLILSIRVGLS